MQLEIYSKSMFFEFFELSSFKLNITVTLFGNLQEISYTEFEKKWIKCKNLATWIYFWHSIFCISSLYSVSAAIKKFVLTGTYYV